MSPHIVAARYFVAILQSLFRAGDVWSVILPDAASLGVMTGIFLSLARASERKRHDLARSRGKFSRWS